MKKWVKIVLVVFVVTIGSGIVLFDVILEGFLKVKLESLIQQQKDRIYDYELEDISIKFISGNLVLSDVKILPRKDVLDSLMAEGEIKKELFAIQLKEFRLIGLDSWRFLLKNELYMETIVFDSPHIIIYQNKSIQKGPSQELAKDIIAPTLSVAIIDEFKLINGSFIVHDIRDNDTIEAVSFDSSHISISSVLTDSTLIKSGEMFTYEEAQIQFKNVKISSMENYRFEIKEISNDFRERKIALHGLRLSPLLDKYEFMKTQKYETDWFKIYVDKLVLNQFDVPYFQKTGKVNLSSLAIENADLELYRDKRMLDPPPKIKPLPSKVFREIDFSISVDEIDISNAMVRYLEWEHNATQPIVVKYENTHGKIENFTTDKKHLKENDSLKMQISSTFMGYAKVDLNFMFPVLDSNDLFYVDGSISNLPLSSLNPIMQHSAFVSFEEGTLNRLEFEMWADDNYSEGKLDIDYSGLKRMQVVRNKEELDSQKEKKGTTKDQKRIMSFVANTLIPTDYNRESKNYYTGKISFERVKEKAIFGYLVKSVLSGIITSIIPNKQENYKEMKKQKKKVNRENKKMEKHAK